MLDLNFLMFLLLSKEEDKMNGVNVMLDLLILDLRML